MQDWKKVQRPGDFRILAEGPEPFANAFMPVWMPPTPPLSDGPYQDEFDVYVDESFDLIYELDPMNEARLPSTIYELHKPFIKPPSPRKEVHHHPPRYHIDSGDHPTTTNVSGLYKGPGTSGGIDKSEFDVYGIADFETPNKSEAQETRTSVSRRDRQRLPPTRPQDPARRLEAPPAAPPPMPEREELDYEGPEWTIIEDMELLNAIRAEEAKGHQLYRHKDSGLMYNWEIVANLVNRVSDFYRSPRQCSLRYQLAIRPREQGLTIAFDPVTMKQRKISVSQVELSHMRKGRATTELMYEHDASRIQSNKWINRFKLIRQQIARHLTAFRRGTFDEHIVKSVRGELPSDQEAKLTSLGVNYHNPVDLEHIIKAQEERAYDHQVKQTDKRKAERVPSEERPPTPPPMFIVSRKNAVPVDPKDYKPIVRQPLFMEMLPISPPAPFPPTAQQLAQMQQPPQRLPALQQQIQGQGSSQIAMQGLAQGQTVQQQAPQDAQPLLPRRTGSVPSALQQLPSQPNVAVSQSMSTAASSSIAAGTAPHGYVVVTGPQSSSAGETKSETVRLQPLPSRPEPGTTQSGSMPPSTAPQAIYRSIQPSQVSNQGQQAGSVGAGAGGQVTGIIQQVKRAPGQGTQMQIGRTPVAYMAASGGQGQGQQIGNVYSTQIVVQQGRGQTQAQGADGVRRPVQRVTGPQPGRMYTSGERFVVATGSSQAQQAGGQAHTQMRLVASGQRIAAAGQGQGQPIQVGITQAGVVGTTIQTQKRIHQQGPITAGMMLQRAPGQQGNPQQIRGSSIQGRYAQQPRIMVTNTGTGQIRQAVPPGQHAQAGTGTMRQILSRGPMTGAGGQVIARGSGGSPQTVGVLLAPPPTTSSSSADPTSNASSPAPSASSPLSGGPPMLQPQVRTSSPMHQKQAQQNQQQDGQG